MQGKDRWLVISIMALLLVVIMIVLPASAYKVKAREIPFDNLSLQTAYISNQQAGTQLQIITDPTVAPTLPILPADQVALQSVDYSLYFVAAVFFGTGASPQSRVTKISQYRDVVWLRSDFPTPSGEGESFAPYQLLKIAKSAVKYSDPVIFKLVNEVFVDKAASTQYNFPAP
jgi:hypothetical protein